jgi:nucleoside-diphosphate-sugar epimerase
VDGVIHLACISNDPSFELDPTLGKSINYDATVQLINLSREAKVKRFIYASSSSVYGVKKEPEVTENLPLKPLTDYSKYKALSEKYLLEHMGPMTPIILRPATVCGWSPRLRLDLTVNILTISALVNKKITVFGGTQKRPNIHIEDIADCYVKILQEPDKKIARKIYNVGYENYSLIDIAHMVKKVVGDSSVRITVTPTNDLRSYSVSSKKIYKELGFKAKHTVEDAISDLKKAYKAGAIPNALTDSRYYNIRTMKRYLERRA